MDKGLVQVKKNGGFFFQRCLRWERAVGAGGEETPAGGAARGGFRENLVIVYFLVGGGDSS